MLKAPDITREGCFQVVGKVKASVGADKVQKCEEWTEQFGSDGVKYMEA
jgi:hypothetical protein